jgi:hypothetical protein
VRSDGTTANTQAKPARTATGPIIAAVRQRLASLAAVASASLMTTIGTIVSVR